MRWIRKRSLIAAAIVIPYFYFAHVSRDGSIVAITLIASMLIILGSAFFDRILFDPSAVYIEKPWRLLQPSAGDVFRLVSFGILTCLTLPLVILRGSFLSDAGMAEAGLISLFFFTYELARNQIERVRWHGSGLEVRSKLGHQTAVKWSNISGIRKSIFGEYLVFRDKNGHSVKINCRLRGYSEFMRDAERYVSAQVQIEIRTLK